MTDDRQSLVEAVCRLWPGGLTGREAVSVLEALEHLVALSSPKSTAYDGFTTLCLLRSRALSREARGKAPEARAALEGQADEANMIPQTLAGWADMLFDIRQNPNGGTDRAWTD